VRWEAPLNVFLESDVLYTTLDILLNFKYDDITMDINKNSIVDNNDDDNANKPDNKIFDEIGDSLMSYIVSEDTVMTL
jgi:predicted AlkP superfamily pyrophosphatase or phosphodiesterase